LKIYGLEYTLERARMLLDVFNWQNWASMFQVEFIQVQKGTSMKLIEDESILVSASLVQHLIPTIGIRVDFKDEKLSAVYSCDTEPCANLDALALGADVLIQEAAGPDKGHTSPEQAGMIAKRAGVKKLILIHFDDRRKPDEQIAEVKLNYPGSVELAHDLMEVI
jgi:ribonuclease Z